MLGNHLDEKTYSDVNLESTQKASSAKLNCRDNNGISSETTEDSGLQDPSIDRAYKFLIQTSYPDEELDVSSN